MNVGVQIIKVETQAHTLPKPCIYLRALEPTLKQIASIYSELHSAIQLSLDLFFQRIRLLRSGMNSPVISKVFQQLFAHRTCSRRICTYSVPRSITAPRRNYYKKGSQETQEDGGSTDGNWQQRTDLLPADKAKDYERYPMVDATALRNRKIRPRRVKMLMRDFIEGSPCAVQLKCVRNMADSKRR